MMIKEAIEKVVKKVNLSEAQIHDLFGEIMSGKTTPAQIGAFSTALRMKGETVEEITGAARAMRERAVHIQAGKKVVDTCGTGGSSINTFNI